MNTLTFPDKKNTDLLNAANTFYNTMNKRRSVRAFDDSEIPIELILESIKAAGTAPSGANMQPWFFAVIRDENIKKQIRLSAEKEEYEFYTKRADKQFLEDLSPFNVTWEKPHLEEASALIVIFSKSFEINEGDKKRSYYAKESVGIATGILITALHSLGISTLTHTPNPMNFLSKILDRPKGEKAFLILAIGGTQENYKAADVKRKNIDQICSVY